jgi:hypothetical protein
MSKVEQLTEIMARESMVFSRFHALYLSADKSYRRLPLTAVFIAPAVQAAVLSECVTYSAWNSKESYDMVCEFFLVRFNGFMSLTS